MGVLQQPRLPAPHAAAVRAVCHPVGHRCFERCAPAQSQVLALWSPRRVAVGAVVAGYSDGVRAVSSGVEPMKFRCDRCGDSGWCCEEHPKVPKGHALPAAASVVALAFPARFATPRHRHIHQTGGGMFGRVDRRMKHGRKKESPCQAHSGIGALTQGGLGGSGSREIEPTCDDVLLFGGRDDAPMRMRPI